MNLLLFSQIFLLDVVFSEHCKLFVQQDGNICLNDAISDTNPEIPRRNHDLKSIIEENIDFWKNQREARKANPAPLVDTGITNLAEGTYEKLLIIVEYFLGFSSTVRAAI